MKDLKLEIVTVLSFDGEKLAGTLTLPPQPKKIAITLHGSFIQTRNGDLDGNQTWMFPQGTPQRNLFRDIAESLLSVGVGTFRFDKRASGESGGNYQETDLSVLAKDASSVLEHMRRCFPSLEVGFIAQSEGSLVVLKAWEIGARPDFIILQAPSLAPLDQLMEFQRDHAAKPFLNDVDGTLTKKFPYLAAFYQAVFNGDMLAKVRATNQRYYELRIGDWHYKTNLQKYREYGWDGYEMLKSVTCPVRIILGTLDLNVPRAPIDRIVSEKAQGAFPLVEVKILPDLEHSFREVRPGETFIEAMAKPVSPEFIKVLQDLFAKNWRI